MDGTITTAALYGLGGLGLAISAARIKSRLELSRAKHASLGGHARIARTIGKLLPSYAYDQDRIFAVDAAPAAIAAARQTDFQRLAALFRSRHPQTL